MIFGDGTPAFWPLAMVPAALAAGNVVDRSTDPVVDVLGAAQRVAEHEYNPTAAAVATCWRFRAAATRSDAFSASPVGAGQAFPLSVAGLGIKTNPVCWNADRLVERAARRAPGPHVRRRPQPLVLGAPVVSRG